MNHQHISNAATVLSFFTMVYNLVRHLKNVHKLERNIKCAGCQTFFGTEQAHREHCRSTHEIGNVARSEPNAIGSAVLHRDIRSLKGHFQTLRFQLDDSNLQVDPFEYLVRNEAEVRKFVDKQLENPPIKFSICLKVDFAKPINDDQTTSYFSSLMNSLTTSLTTEEFFNHVDQILTQISIFCTY